MNLRNELPRSPLREMNYMLSRRLLVKPASPQAQTYYCRGSQDPGPCPCALVPGPWSKSLVPVLVPGPWGPWGCPWGFGLPHGFGLALGVKPVRKRCYQDDAWADKEKQAGRHASQKNRKTNLPACLQQALTHDHLPSANLTLLQLLLSRPTQGSQMAR